MSFLFGGPKKAGPVAVPRAPSIKPTPTEESKMRAEMESARKRRAGLARTLLSGASPLDETITKTKLGQ